MYAASLEYRSELVLPRDGVVVGEGRPFRSDRGYRMGDVGRRVVPIAQRGMTVQIDPYCLNHKILRTGGEKLWTFYKKGRESGQGQGCAGILPRSPDLVETGWTPSRLVVVWQP
jgi:hypothetical protein